MPPELAPVLASNPLIDWIEPIHDRYLQSSGGASAARAALFAQTTPWGIDTIGAPDAWEKTDGDGAKIMILDTGHERGHEDLPLVSLGNCGGVGPEGCDDSGTQNYHGTKVTGSAIALDNSDGTVGVAPGVDGGEVFVWSVFDGTSFDQDSFIEALDSASAWGVEVINMSWGSSSYDATEAAALHTAKEDDDILLVAAAGNNTGTTFNSYPASLLDVLSVSGINSNKAFANPSNVCHTGANRSNYGILIDLSAPFDNYMTSGPDDDDYETDCGTSFSAPMVAGTAALVRALAPNLSAYQVMQRLRSTARDLGTSGWDQYFGYGMVDAYDATGPWPNIVGPDEVQTNDEECGWVASVAGGYGSSYTYAWYVADSLIGTSATVSYEFPEEEGGVELKLEVWDGQSVKAEDILEILVDDEVDGCTENQKVSGRGI